MIHGLYVAVEFCERSNLALSQFCEKYKIKRVPGNFHCTVVYSTAWIQHRSFKLNEQVKPVEFELYDSMYGKVLVLKVASSYLYPRHYQLLREGANHTFDRYNPHITLGTFDGSISDLDIKEVPILTASLEYSEKLK